VPRPRTYKQAARTQMITVRVTPDEHARLAAEAAQLGTCVAGLAERYITRGSVRMNGPAAPSIHPAVIAELKRIALTLHEVASLPPGQLPPKTDQVAGTMRDLLQLLVKDELLAQRLHSLKTRSTANDSTPASPRQEFQRVMHLRPARSERQEP
jgi:hypothetical protein